MACRSRARAVNPGEKDEDGNHDGPPIEADSPLKYWAGAGCSSSRGLHLNGGLDPQAGCVVQLSPLYA
jgi:hypothetical protein